MCVREARGGKEGRASGQVGTHHSISIRQPNVDRTLGSSLKPDACLRPVLSSTRAAVAHAATLPFALAKRSSSWAEQSKTSDQSSL